MPRLIRDAGPEGTDAYFPIIGEACAALEAATVRQIIDRHLDNVAAGRLDLTTSPTMSAWGRRPDGPSWALKIFRYLGDVPSLIFNLGLSGIDPG